MVSEGAHKRNNYSIIVCKKIVSNKLIDRYFMFGINNYFMYIYLVFTYAIAVQGKYFANLLKALHLLRNSLRFWTPLGTRFLFFINWHNLLFLLMLGLYVQNLDVHVPLLSLFLPLIITAASRVQWWRDPAPTLNISSCVSQNATHSVYYLTTRRLVSYFLECHV